ncbi:MAG: YgiT-type zinc finger protein [Myxococcaceae bacterium]
MQRPRSPAPAPWSAQRARGLHHARSHGRARSFAEHCGARILEVGAGIGTITAQLEPGRDLVPARVCPRCGERYISALVVRQMDRQMKSRRSRSHIISVPVISLGPAG